MSQDPPAKPENISGAMDLPSWGVLLSLGMVWGGSFFFVELALIDFTPLTIVAVRVGLAAVLLHLYMVLTKRQWPKDKRFYTMVAIMGLTNNALPFLLLVWSQTHITGGLASILNATTPIFAVVVAHIMTQDERITAAKVLSVLTGFLGVAIIIGPDVMHGMDAGLLAQIAPLGAALCYAFSTTFSRKFKALNVRPSTVATGQLTASSLMLIPLALIVDQPWQLTAPSMTSLVALLALATVSTAIAYIAYFRFVAKNGAINLALVTFLVPISAILLGAVFLGEVMLPRHWIGMALIGFCFVILDGRPLKFLKNNIKI